MFPVDAQYTGRKLDKAYVEARAKWEPMYEVSQIKGDGEAHPFLSPDDAFADYETWDVGNLDLTEAKRPDMLAGEYAREALKNGLLLESRLGTNPYKFGMVGSTDSHTALSAIEEDNFFGKHAGTEPSPERVKHPFTKTPQGEFKGWQSVASGLAAVWATENTREAIFDAMARKEVYATTGTRLMVRFFGGWNYSAEDLNSRQPAFRGYQKGVPMGGDLPRRKGAGAPVFMVYALRDPIGANLDRIQIVKGWLDAQGKTHEKVYDVAWSDRTATRREGRPATGRQYGGHQGGELDQHDRGGGAGYRLEGPRLRSGRVGVLLRPRDRDPDTALGGLRCVPLRDHAPGRCGDDCTGAGLHLTDLVLAHEVTGRW